MKALVLGAGISGIAAAKFLAQKDFSTTISDISNLSDQKMKVLNDLKINFISGPQTPKLFETHYDLLIVSPGIPPEHTLIKIAKKNHIPIRTEIGLALEYYQGKIIGVTGTNGKSTICKMIEHLGSLLGYQIKAGGNIGIPLCSLINQKNSQDALVVELSSYQLQWEPIPTHLMIYSSFSQDHIDRHKSLKNYFLTKWRATEFLQPGGQVYLSEGIYQYIKKYHLDFPNNFRLVNFTDKDKNFVHHYHPGHQTTETIDHLDFRHTKLFFHDRINASLAIYALAKIFSESTNKVFENIFSYQSLPHRMERFYEFNQVVFINDSKSTNLESTLMALSAINTPILLLLGGQSKKEKFDAIGRFRDKIYLIICFGDSGDEIYQTVNSFCTTIKVRNVKNSISVIRTHLIRKSTVLFSPGCSSFDEFSSFEHRGTYFKNAILESANETKS